jgi:hypothetical protein
VMLHFVAVLIVLSGDRNPFLGLTREGQAGFFMVGLYLTAPVFAARYFQALANPAPALLALMRPASTFEKWLLALLVVGVAYPLAFHLAFYVCDLPAMLYAQGQAEAAHAAMLAEHGADVAADLAEAIEEKGGYTPFWIFGLERHVLVPTLLAIAALQGFAVAGTVVFRRWPFVKTLLAGFVVLLGVLLFAAVLEGDPDVLFDYWTNAAKNPLALTAAQHLLMPAAWIAVPALLWLAAWRGLREREIA